MSARDLCGATENRTRDTRIFSPLLYQLSYGTIPFVWDYKDRQYFLQCKLFRHYFLENLPISLFLRDFQLHSGTDIRSDSIELHDIICTDARIVLRDSVERISGLHDIDRVCSLGCRVCRWRRGGTALRRCQGRAV